MTKQAPYTGVKLEQARRNKASARARSPFSIWHCPVGTRVIIESPFIKLKEGEKTYYEDQIYGCYETVVEGATMNGVDSYLIKVPKLREADLSDYPYTNVDWVREVLVRGPKDTKMDLDNEFNRKVLSDRPKHPDEYNKHHSQYFIGSLREFVVAFITAHPRYRHIHDLIDLENLIGQLAEDPFMKASEIHMGNGYNVHYLNRLVNKKKFNALLKRKLAKAKMRRDVQAAIEKREHEEMYRRDMEWELRNESYEVM